MKTNSGRELGQKRESWKLIVAATSEIQTPILLRLPQPLFSFSSLQPSLSPLMLYSTRVQMDSPFSFLSIFPILFPHQNYGNDGNNNNDGDGASQIQLLKVKRN